MSNKLINKLSYTHLDVAENDHGNVRMKFRVESEEHSALIQQALFRLGYFWQHGVGLICAQHHPYLYAGDHGAHITHGYGDAHFEKSENEEYVYRLGLVEPRNGRPVRDVPPPVFTVPGITSTVITSRRQADMAFLAGRNRLIVSQMHEMLKNDINAFFPEEWLSELSENVKEIRKLEEST